MQTNPPGPRRQSGAQTEGGHARGPNDTSYDCPQAWLVERDLVDHSIRDPWETSLDDEAAIAAQREYDSTPALRELLTKAAASDSVVRSRRERSE